MSVQFGTEFFAAIGQLAAREQAYSKVWARIIKDSGFQPQ